LNGKMSILQTLKNRFGKAEKAVLKLWKDIAQDQRRSPVTQTEREFSVLEPEYDYEILNNWGKFNPVLGNTHESIITECTRNKGKVAPRWLRKCPSCGTEFQTEKETCPDCNVETVKPSLDQKALLEAFIEDPNQTDEIGDIQKSCYRYMLRLSDWYISIQKANLERLTPITIYVEDSSKIRICGDKHGNLGNGEFFCSNCVGKHPEISYPPNGKCTFCGNTNLKETCYIYLDGTIKARWAKDEMLHGKLDPNLPSLYGWSREIRILTTLSTLQAMDDYNFDNYSEGKLGNILVFEGLSQTDANDLAEKAKLQKNKPELNSRTGRWFVKKLKTLFLGSGGKGAVTNVPAMPESEKMQSLDWWKLWRETVHAAYGVQDVAAGEVQQGTTGQNPRMKLDINNNTTEMYQHAWADPFNNILVKEALGVTDWIYEFNPVEEKDEAQDQAILQAKLTNIEKAIALGMKAELTDEEEVKISGEPMTLEEKNQMQIDKFKQQQQANPPFEGSQPFKKENVFANEKGERIKSKHIVLEVEPENE